MNNNKVQPVTAIKSIGKSVIRDVTSRVRKNTNGPKRATTVNTEQKVYQRDWSINPEKSKSGKNY